MIQLLNIAEPQTAHSTSDWYTLTSSTLHHIIEKTHIHEPHTQTIIRRTHTNMHTVNMRDSVFNNLTQQRDADCKTLFPGITFIITFLQVNISKWEWASESISFLFHSNRDSIFPFQKKKQILKGCLCINQGKLVMCRCTNTASQCVCTWARAANSNSFSCIFIYFPKRRQNRELWNGKWSMTAF